VHYKFIAYNCLKVVENSTIWQSLQEDQDRAVPSTLRLEARAGQRNALQEITQTACLFGIVQRKSGGEAQ
jgi:hypothetical protein